MNNPDNRAFLYDIGRAIDQIEQYTDKVTWSEFVADKQKQDAVVRQLEVIGEAANRVTKDYSTEHSEIPWKKITGMRHKLIHDYFDVQLEEVWQVVSNDLGPLKSQIKDLL